MTKPSITAIGLETYLAQTADRHNGLNYTDFVKWVDKLPTFALAKMFNVSRPTMYKWVAIYEQDQLIDTPLT